MHKPATFFAMVIFALVAIAHLIRLIFGMSVIVGGWSVPIWFSFIGVIVPGVLSLGLWREGRSG